MQDAHQISKVVHTNQVSKSNTSKQTDKQVEQISPLPLAMHLIPCMHACDTNIPVQLTWPTPPAPKEEAVTAESASGHESSLGRPA